MSYSGNAQFEYFVDGAINRRTVAEIQRKIIKQGKRNAVSRLAHAKNDKETIATWRLDLDRILLVFNVRSVISVWLLLLTAHSQTELAINTHVTVSDIRHNVVNTHTIVSDIRNDVVNTHTIVSDIHRNMLKSREDMDGQNWVVSITRTLPVAE